MTTSNKTKRADLPDTLVFHDGNWYLAEPGCITVTGSDFKYEDYADILPNSVADPTQKQTVLAWCDKDGAIICFAGQELFAYKLDEDPKKLAELLGRK